MSFWCDSGFLLLDICLKLFDVFVVFLVVLGVVFKRCLVSFPYHFNIILVSFLGPVGIIWRPLGTSVGHLGEKFTLWGAMC